MAYPTHPDNWRKSSYSGPGDGNDCVEIANSPTNVAIRDSKIPDKNNITVGTATFTTFVGSLKDAARRG